MRVRSLPAGEERRSLTLSDAGVTVDQAGDARPRFAGHAAVFNSRTAIGNPATFGFLEEVAPGAFSKTISEGDARMLIDHDSAHVVSRVSAGTLRLSQDVTGLAVDADLDTGLSYVNDLVANLRNGNITGMSFGFQVIKDDWSTETQRSADGAEHEVEVRVIREAKLFEVSPVTFPAYESTDAGLRDTLVTALRHRGDPEAVARRAAYRPELADLLEDMPPAKCGHEHQIRLDGKKITSVVRGVSDDLAVKPFKEQDLPGEVLGNDQPIKPTGTQMVPVEESTSEPAASTRTDDTSLSTTSDESSEPAASTRNAPSEHQMAKVELLRHRAAIADLIA